MVTAFQNNNIHDKISPSHEEAFGLSNNRNVSPFENPFQSIKNGYVKMNTCFVIVFQKTAQNRDLLYSDKNMHHSTQNVLFFCYNILFLL